MKKTVSYANEAQSSFYEANARTRAYNLVDSGTFTEIHGPGNHTLSPHLPVLGEAVSFDDGVVTGVGLIGKRPVFVISQEGKFIGGSVGEVGGAKMVGMFDLALSAFDEISKKYPNEVDLRRPSIVISFETGGVRLHEANAGLLAHAEVMELIQKCRGKVPVISLVGSRLGCFGGMGFVCVATDVVIMNELGRIGLTGPEVIEEVMGKKEFDASDRALIYRTTGGKHKYIMRDASYLVNDTIDAFKKKITQVLNLSYEEISSHRIIGSKGLVLNQMEGVKLAARLSPKDSKDVWKYFGNQAFEEIQDFSYEQFMSAVKRAPERSDFHG